MWLQCHAGMEIGDVIVLVVRQAIPTHTMRHTSSDLHALSTYLSRPCWVVFALMFQRSLASVFLCVPLM
jgi:hypothetical protein